MARAGEIRLRLPSGVRHSAHTDHAETFRDGKGRRSRRVAQPPSRPSSAAITSPSCARNTAWSWTTARRRRWQPSPRRAWRQNEPAGGRAAGSSSRSRRCVGWLWRVVLAAAIAMLLSARRFRPRGAPRLSQRPGRGAERIQRAVQDADAGQCAACPDGAVLGPDRDGDADRLASDRRRDGADLAHAHARPARRAERC